MFYRRQLPLIEKCLPDFYGSPKRCSPNNFYIIKCLCIVHVKSCYYVLYDQVKFTRQACFVYTEYKTLLIYIQTPKPMINLFRKNLNLSDSDVFRLYV